MSYPAAQENSQNGTSSDCFDKLQVLKPVENSTNVKVKLKNTWSRSTKAKKTQPKKFQPSKEPGKKQLLLKDCIAVLPTISGD